jgi:2,5-diketo-D-gluconate reductase A
MASLAPQLSLNDGTSIPQLGLGTWPLNDAEVAATVEVALGLGYRHIDTAAKYGNETGVGVGIAAGLDAHSLTREDVFVTTKLDGGYQGNDLAIAGLEASLVRLNLDYVDLLLIHWPLPARDEYVSTWRTFIELRARGLTRSIGVSNFTAAHLQRLVSETGVVPAVNQIEINPCVVRLAQREANVRLGIHTVSYSPLAIGGALLTDARITAIAAEHDRTPAQIVLRWHVQQGLVAIPKSRDAARLASNLSVFDFELSAANLETIAELAEGPDAGVDSDISGH